MKEQADKLLTRMNRIRMVLVRLWTSFENYNTVYLPFRVLTFRYKVTYLNEMLRRKSTWDKTINLNKIYEITLLMRFNWLLSNMNST